MKFLCVGLVFGMSAVVSSAAADHVVINERYMVSKDEVRGYFYRDRDQRVVFDIRWDEWSTQYRCDDEYDRARVTAASLNFIAELKDAQSLDFGDFLDSEGFQDCRKF